MRTVSHGQMAQVTKRPVMTFSVDEGIDVQKVFCHLCFSVGSLMYLGPCDVEMLTGATAVERAVERLSSDEAAKLFTTVGFKVTPAGMTVTDNERK